MILTLIAVIVLILLIIAFAIPLAILETIGWIIVILCLFVLIFIGAIIIDILMLPYKIIKRLIRGKEKCQTQEKK